MTTTIIIPDVHLPYPDQKALDNLFTMISVEQPERIVQIGDLLDLAAPSRWSRGKAEEYIGNVNTEIEHARGFWSTLRDAAPHAELVFISGNHDTRLHSYAAAFAPALLPIIPDLPSLMHLEKHGVKNPKQPWQIAPGVKAIHGKLIASSAGLSARKEMLRHGHSIVQGHTHRLGVVYETTDRVRFAMECGWLGDIRKAGSYLDFPGVANWQSGFGYIEMDGKHVSPGVVPVHNSKFSFRGKYYG